MDIIATDFKATWKKTRYVFQDINRDLYLRIWEEDDED
jgi:hypothetical protein